MSFKRLVLEISKSIPKPQFTVEELRSLCERDFPTMDTSKLHAKVYKTMWVLKKEGLLDCLVSEESTRNNKWFLTADGHSLLDSANTEAESLELIHKQGLQDLIDALKGKLSDFSVQLAIISYEVQQYHDLSREFPNLSPKLKPIFQDAKQRAIVFEGRVKAIENTLKEIEQ